MFVVKNKIQCVVLIIRLSLLLDELAFVSCFWCSVHVYYATVSFLGLKPEMKPLCRCFTGF